MDYCKLCMSPIKLGARFCTACGKSQDVEMPLHHLLPGSLLKRRFVVGTALGEGGFGITYIGRDLLFEDRVAIKEFYPNGYANRNNAVSAAVLIGITADRKLFFEKGKQRFLNEAKILARFRDEDGIVSVRDFFEENNTAYIVMEYVDGKTLKDIIEENGRLAPDVTVSLFMPVLKSLRKVHAQELIHRDISPDNIMVSGDKVKLLDFGAARTMSAVANKSLSVVLKPGYAPEEQYRSKGNQGPWTDVYALCATMYKCITGVTPDDATQRVYHDDTRLPSELGVEIDQELEAVIIKGMAVNQGDRFQSVDELLDALKESRNGAILPLNQAIAAAAGGAAGAGTAAVFTASDSDATAAVFGTPGANRAADVTDYNTEFLNKESNTGIVGEDSGTVLPGENGEGEKKKKKAFILIPIIGLLVLAMIGGLLFFLFKDKDSKGNDNTMIAPTPVSYYTDEPTQSVDNTPDAAPTDDIITEAPTEEPTEESTRTPTEAPTQTPAPGSVQTPTLPPTGAPAVQTPTYVIVSFNAGEGSLSPDPVTAEVGSSYDFLRPLTRTGFEFESWYTSPSGGSKVTTGTIVSTPVNHTLYAHWKVNQYTVNWNNNVSNCTITVRRVSSPNAGAASGTLSSGNIVYYGDVLNVTYTPATGYRISSSGNSPITVSGNVTSADIYASVSSIPSYTLTFKANDGSASKTSRSLRSGEEFGTLPTLNRDGYSFDGWFTSASGGSKVTPSTKMGNSDQTVYAHWTLISYSVNWNNVSSCTITVTRTDSPNAGKGTGTLSKGDAVYFGDKLSITYSPAKGYHIENCGADSITVTGAITQNEIYASVKVNTYTVRFDANGGSGSMPDQSFTYGTSQTLRSNTFTKTNCVFLGWSTTNSTTTATYSDGQSVKNLTSVHGKTVTLYAVWESVSISDSSLQMIREPSTISLDNTSLRLVTSAFGNYSKTATLTPVLGGYSNPTKTISAEASDNASVSWSTNNPSVATVSNGKITAKSAGTAIITASTLSGAKATCTVKVSNGSVSVSWETSNSGVATVSSGKVTAVKKGTATIMATASNGAKATCSVTVGKTYKAVALTSSSAYADFNCDNKGGLFSYSDEANTSFAFTFMTGNTVPSEGCLYQCYNGSLQNGFMVTFSSGKVSVTEDYVKNKIYTSTQTSDYILSANTVYTVEVSFNKVTSSLHNGTITIKDESGTILSTKSCSWNCVGCGSGSVASIGPNASVKNGAAPNVYLMSINFTGSVIDNHLNSVMHSCFIDFSAGSVGSTTFTGNDTTITFKNTSVQQYVLFP